MAVLVAAVAVVACSDDDNAKKKLTPLNLTPVQKGTLKPGDPAPAPTGPTVLTISGHITNTNATDSTTGAKVLKLDMATLERLDLHQFTADDSIATGHRATFRGVLLSDLMKFAGISSTATKLHTAAVNDYVVDIPVAEMNKIPVLVASMTNGERMKVATYGPLRVVYPNLNYDVGQNASERSIWQLISIEAE